VVAPGQVEGVAWGSGKAPPPSHLDPPSRSSELGMTVVNIEDCVGLPSGKITGLNLGFRIRWFFGVFQFAMFAARPCTTAGETCGKPKHVCLSCQRDRNLAATSAVRKFTKAQPLLKPESRPTGTCRKSH